MEYLIKWLKNQFFFNEVDLVIKLSSKRTLQVDDLEPLSLKKIDKDSDLGLSLDSVWHFIRHILRINWRPISLGLFFSCFRLAFALSTPVLIRQILVAIADSNTMGVNLVGGLTSAFLFAGASILGGIVMNQCFYWDFVAFQAHQRTIDHLIFHQMLKLSPNSRSKFHSSDVIDSIGNDSQTIAKLGFLVDDTFYVISIFIGVTLLLIHYIGLATIAALGTLIIVTPIAGYLAKHFEKCDYNRADLRESRLNLISQMLSGIRTAKLYNFTGLLESKIRKLRKEEVGHHISWGIRSAMSIVVFGSVTTLVCLVTFGTSVVLGQSLNPTVLFPTLGLLMLLELPLANVADILSTLSSIKVAGQRVLNFLRSQKSLMEVKPLSEPGVALGVNIENMSFNLSVEDEPILRKINLVVRPGESVAVVGSVGSGKSVLIRCLLEEDERLSGVIKWNGLSPSQMPRIAYAPQEAFIFNGTLKENLLIGDFSEGSEDMLKRALKVTLLEEDLKQFHGGLEIEIGERGVNLSGGQKQRVSLARSVISQPGIVLLDDPFSAVDSKTEEQLVERLLFSEWGSITRIVATHRLRFLNRFDKIVFMQNGQIAAQGTISELLKRQDFRQFYSEEQIEKSLPSDIGAKAEVMDNVPLDDSANEPLRITEDEDRRTGRMGKKVYGAFLNAVGGGQKNPHRAFMFAALAITMVFAVIVPIIQNLWLVIWSDPKSLGTGSILRNIAESPWRSLLVYAGIGVFALIAIFVQRALWNRQVSVASRILHDDGLAGVIRAPIRFFDSTASGVIINRFSRDVLTIENDLRWMFENMVRCVCQALVSITFIIVTLPWLSFFIVPILWGYYKIQQKFSIASRELKRLVQVTQSPLFSHLRETYEGLITIRTLDRSKYFAEKFSNRHTAFLRASRAQVLIDRWFSVRVPVLSGGISLISAVSFFLAAVYNQISAGLAGVILTYLISFWTLLNWSARTFAMVEGNLTSVERLIHLAELPVEGGPLQQHRKERQTYTTSEKGSSIEFKSAFVRYAQNLPDILKGVSFSVAPGSHVGIVGRTGSGKSTILQGLVGMAEVSKGDILLDGVPIKQFSLHELREMIAVIPQDPFLFSETIRMNLDPTGMHSDDKLMEIINKVGMEEFMASQAHGLDTVISENGGNLSQGQKQLLCFARALLKRPKIIIMDEATSNVDVQTESRINSQLKTAVDGITVLIIAHRTSTVLGCDQIIRLTSGMIENITIEKGDNCE